MPYKDPEKQKAYNREYGKKHYKKYKKKIMARTKESRKKYQKEWHDFKAEQKCSLCGYSHPAAIDFHHIVPSENKVNALASQRKYKQAILEATTKCIPICANCHRKLHWEEHKKRVPKDPSSDD